MYKYCSMRYIIFSNTYIYIYAHVLRCLRKLAAAAASFNALDAWSILS